MTIDLSRDIQSLSTFKRNTNETIARMKSEGNPLVLTVNGKAEIVVQDVAAYQKLLDKINHLENLIDRARSTKDKSSSDLLDLYGAAAGIEFAIDDQGISEDLDNDLAGALDE